MKPFLSLIGMMMLAATAQAASFKLETDNAEPIYQTTLTKEVYQYSNHDHLKDLAIINADGESVPYALLPYQKIHQQTKVMEKSKPLVIFPMQIDALSQAEVNIQLNNHGNDTSINVSSSDTKTQASTFYLFDLGEKHPAFKKLTVDWQGVERKLFTVNIMTSNHLKDWSLVGQGALLKVSANGQAIIQNSINLDKPISARYLKIQPIDAIESFVLTGVNVEFNQTQDLVQPKFWQEISMFARVQNNAETHIDFESTSRLPATFLKVSLPQQNTITQATISTKNHKDQPWKKITSASLYQLNKKGRDFVNQDISIPKTTARYWRLTFNQAKGGIGKESPQLSLGWLPDSVIWNARGTGPFNLQVNENSTANIVPIANLIKPFNAKIARQLPSARLHLTTQGQHVNTWDLPKDNKRLWLWAGLLLGVFALAAMAYSLIKNNSTT